MKFTKTTEKTVLKVYHAYWDAYLKGDMKTFSDILSRDCHIIGSTAFDIFDSKKKAVKFYNETAGQITDKVSFRNRKIKLLPYTGNVMVQEFCDFYLLIDNEWTFYAHARLSTLLGEKDSSWKIIHQHGSMPDSRAEEGEQVATKKIKAENLTLRDAVSRRTVELAQKNRELEIEASLEKVRAIALSMKEPADMLEICKTIALELGKLGVPHIRNVQTAIFNTERENYMNYEYYLKYNKTIITETGYTSHKIQRDFASQMLKGNGEFFSTHISKAKLPEWIKYQETTNVFIDAHLKKATSLSYYWCSLGQVALGMSAYKKLNESEIYLFNRFRNVFNLSYQRYADILLAKAQAREAKIEVALERVRARALAMQQPEEIKDVAEVLRLEMAILGVEELETSSIYIHSEREENKAECWYAIKDDQDAEKRLVADNFRLDLNDTWVGRQMLQFYRSHENQTSIVMRGEERKEWIHYCERHSSLLLNFYGDNIPDRTYHLYKFSHGAIGAATPAGISDESWSLLKRAASVFSLAYSRFSDLTKARHDLQNLKEEKLRAENALTELQATQKQLIHAEKMASLGELTAGIAHEIQNPLNFVNNFSEVSYELLGELKTEREKNTAERDMQLEDELLADIAQNLEKINHHGKRADAIVKGMLQHSNNKVSIKELTDVNKLTDEYIRLCYHGIRAKDKLFNATIHTELDKTIEKINIIPQDIGRVLLNLLTNAFYAVNEKKNLCISDYEPTVTVSTSGAHTIHNGRSAITIKVGDNGNGISQAIINKIFQPFFTTKPTGQGTGLGLSLAYDIIQAHEGEIKVETAEGKGTTFIIQLPL